MCVLLQKCARFYFLYDFFRRALLMQAARPDKDRINSE